MIAAPAPNNGVRGGWEDEGEREDDSEVTMEVRATEWGEGDDDGNMSRSMYGEDKLM